MTVKQKQDRYEMHKYWGKKPSNNLAVLIKKYSKEGETVLDPFSGYGVFCCEAFLMGRNVISNDLNPIAAFLNKQLLEGDIDLELLQKQWQNIKSEFEPYVMDWYSWDYYGARVRLTSILRTTDGVPIKAKAKTITDNKTLEIQFDEAQIKKYLEYEKAQSINDWYPENELIVNSRISAKKGMKVSDLFTKRTLACHARLLSLIEKHSTGNEKELLKVAFTANLANCSKLVPPIKSRGELSQGAWMTGFYVGPTYIENNVLVYFENRFRKILKGKADYLQHLSRTMNQNAATGKNRNKYLVLQNDAKNLGLKANSIDYVFTDPPYGGAVPYFEQSIIWNSWLKLTPDYENEIVVTDSKEREKNTKLFEAEINLAFAEIRRVLKEGRLFSFTYHSLSGFEWKAITNACILNSFEIYNYEWLVQKSFTPRQINRSTSIKGDVLVTVKKVGRKKVLAASDEEVSKILLDHIKSWLAHKELDTNEVFLRIMKVIFSDKIIIGNVNVLWILKENFSFTEINTWTTK